MCQFLCFLYMSSVIHWMKQRLYYLNFQKYGNHYIKSAESIKIQFQEFVYG